MGENKFKPLFLIGLFLVSQAFSHAEAKEKKPKAKAKKSSPTSPGNKKKTVGELLKQADRGANIQSGSKSGIALPQAGELFDQKKSNVNLSAVKPPRVTDLYENVEDDKAKLEKITEQQISELFKLTQRFGNSPQRGELWLRLAELYVEKAGIIDFRRQADYDKKLQEFQDGKIKVKPVLNTNESREYHKKAIQLYEWFLRDFPKDEKVDQALFFLGYNYYELNELAQGTNYYKRLTKEYPRSSYVTEANFALAEFYFENEKWKDAKTYYREVLRNRRHRLFTFSMYKSAWCEYRLGGTAQALKMMENLVRMDKAQTEAAQGKKISKSRLENEGLRDIVLFYAEVGDPTQAPQYFQGLAGKDHLNYLEKLAYYYGDKGNLLGAQTVFTYLISTNPNSAKAFDYKYQVVKLFSNAKRTREFREELFSWVRGFSTTSEWGRANANNKELIENSYKLRETTLRNYILQQHQTAQNSRAPFSQGLALEGYGVYVAEFKDSPTIADMHFYYGELLYDLKKFEEAGAQYRWVVENGQNSKFFARAAENTVLALEKDLPPDGDLTKNSENSVMPIPLDPRVERFISAGRWYIQKIPNSEKAIEVKFRMGRLLYQHNLFDDAIPLFKDVVEKNPTSKYAEYSANLLLDIYNLKKDYAGLEKIGKEMLAMPGFSASKAAGDVKGVLEKANFKKAQDLEGTKEFGESARQFEAFAIQNPLSPLALTAMFNAAINFEKAGLNQKAAQAHTAVLASKDKAGEGMRINSRRILAKLYQDSGQLDLAAQTYRASARELPPNDPLVPNLLFNAAVLYEATGRTTEALANYQAYFETTKKADRYDALFSIATIERKRNFFTKSVEDYKKYIASGAGTPEKNIEAAFHIADITQRLGRRAEAEEWRVKTLNLQRRAAPQKKGPGAEYAAKIKFAETAKLVDELKSLRIPNDPAQQQAVLQKKISMVGKLTNELTEVIQYDSPDEIIGSLNAIGQANLHLAESLIQAPLPKGLNADEMKQYKEGIAQIAEPLFGKAKEALKAAVDRSSQLDAFSNHYREARNTLLRLDPQAVYPGEELAVPFAQGAWIGM